MDPTYPLVPILNFVAAFLTLLPLLINPKMLRNVGVTMLAIWLLSLEIIQGVDAVVWSDHANDVAPVWCDIASHVLIGTEVGIPACTLVLTRQLSRIARMQNTMQSNHEVNNPTFAFLLMLSDLLITIGVPVVAMSIYYVVQTCRFQIFEEYGCYSAEHISGLTLILVKSWGITIPIVSVLFYCLFQMFLALFRIRISEQIEDDDQEGYLIRSQYIRLLIIGCLDITLALPLVIVIFVMNAEQATTLVFYPGWDAIHQDWSPRLIPSTVWRPKFWQAFDLRFNQYVTIVLAVAFFFLLGMTDEAIKKWKRALRVAGHRRNAQDLDASKLSTFAFAGEHTMQDL
ncbi:GPCR fungal pheromone mating factor [Amylostereum chailletii]|nr:GPCR fungal pheromone mating factor [Amylostereum chailletii]